jgi:hypothetical protein
MSGGRRAGSGRKKNTPNKASAARELAAQASGLTPADIMLHVMREFWQLASNTTNARKRGEYLRAANTAAANAAPYFHARRVATAPASSIDLPKIETTADTVKAMTFAMAEMSAGRITSGQLMELSAAIGEMRKAIELQDIRAEMTALEQQVQQVRQSRKDGQS